MIYVTYKELSLEESLDINDDVLKKLNAFYSETHPSYNSIHLKEKRAQKLDVFKLCRSLFKSMRINDFESYRLFKNEKGKPVLKSLYKSNQKYFISITHSKAHVAVALSKEFDIGIDIESSDRFLNHKAYKKWLHTNELDKLKDLSAEDITVLWTKKESLTKATGLGYDLVFKNLDLSKCKDLAVFGSDTYTFVTEKNINDTDFCSLCFKSNDEFKECSDIVDWQVF